MTDDASPMAEQDLSRLALRALLIGAVSMAVILTGLWFRYVDAPPPEEVCDRIIELTYAEGAEHDPKSVERLVEKLREGCVTSKRQIIQYRGKIEWASYARCVAAASDLAGAEGC